ncbi:MAG: HPr family phosphocarrier protein [Clostridia bacterium]|nr:HPr family phosphocarrier protein [Clostridia bacterium]MBQ2947909.1 HPr family phosphocarrier protein [Clostridia bacterium]MBQ4608986.1 HPr family phosphocarrier protein [Clostridia bacterium]MBQ6859721.1 HPr family phosphocarrier protein [Clostridia bacterium]MBQ7052445.1 HPr family phosphocarrier protein [Clostridia bacterium]
MKQFSYVLTRPHGLDARPLSSLAKEASRFSSRVNLTGAEKTAELSETHHVLGMNLGCGSQVKVTIEGRDEEAAVTALQRYFIENL